MKRALEAMLFVVCSTIQCRCWQCIEIIDIYDSTCSRQNHKNMISYYIDDYIRQSDLKLLVMSVSCK